MRPLYDLHSRLDKAAKSMRKEDAAMSNCKGSLETEMSALLEKRKELYSQSRSAKDEDTKSQVKSDTHKSKTTYAHLN